MEVRSIRWLTIAVGIGFAGHALGETFYIDPTYSGLESGTMTQPYNAWTDVTFVDGNTYRQKRGSTYTSGAQIYVNGKQNVTLGAYGEGSRPVFSYTGNGHAIRMEGGLVNCTVEDFEVNGNGGASSLVSIAGTTGTYAQSTIVSNCLLYNAHNANNAGFGIIAFYNNGLKVLNTEIHHVALDGIYSKYEPTIEIGYCNVYDVNRRYFVNPNETASSGDGIQLDGTYDGFHIHHTTIDRTNTAGNKYNLILNSAAGLSDNAFGIIEYCTFITTGNVSSAVHIERGNGIITRYNVFQGSTQGIRLGGQYTKNNLIHNNLFYNCDRGIGIGSTWVSGVAGPCTGTKVYNNVFYHVNTYHIWVDRTPVDARNNIHMRTTDAGVAIHNYGGGSWSLSHNAYSSIAVAGTPGTGGNPVIGNPLFVDAAAYDFRLQNESPCIDAGIGVGLTADFIGSPIPQGGAPDIGAFEKADPVDNFVIQSFDGTGRLTFNELPTAKKYRVEWAPTPSGPWSSTWASLADISAYGSGIVTCSVPMVYRVVAVLP